ncbi:hypothetical protein ACFSGX_12170 [Sphingomonas arantia]|uniref:IS256 family transposase n=1 Tax=Sphingomonas arantia TaxID=1460676 RepID=A0ABW4U0D7_9SPHN
MLKDLRLASYEADEAAAPMLVNALLEQLFERAYTAGLGDDECDDGHS